MQVKNYERGGIKIKDEDKKTNRYFIKEVVQD